MLLEGMQLAVTLGALYLILGVAATGGLLVCVATLPLNLVVMRRVKVLQDRLMKEKDERMALLSEALTLTLTLTLTLSLTLSLTLTLTLTLTLSLTLTLTLTLILTHPPRRAPPRAGC